MKTYIIIPLVVLLLAVGLYLSDRYEHQTNSYEINMHRCKNASFVLLNDKITNFSVGIAEQSFKEMPQPFLAKEGKKLIIRNTDLDTLFENAFVDFPCIERVFFRKNKFKTIPKALKQLPNLTDITLTENQITTLNTTVFEELYALKNLYFSRNPISKLSFPTTESELNTFECQFCELTEIDFIPFVSLRNLDLSNNELTDFPIEVFNLIGLKELRLNNNKINNFNFTAEENQRFSYRGLNSIDLSDNQLIQFPTVLGNLRNLKHLNLYKNNITGKLVTEGFISLEALELPNHFISEVLIRNVARNNYGEESTLDYFLPSMTELNLKNNQITTFEIEGGKNKSIHTINLRDNQLTTFPKALNQFKQLQNIYLSNNSIQSVYISEKFNSPVLHLDLSINQIKKITTNVNMSNNFEKINLSYNQLTTIPSQFITFSSIKKLDLSHNKIKTLNLEKWNGYGYNEIEELDLSNNPIKEWNSDLTYFKNLRILNLSNTKISEISVEDLKKMPILEILILKNTKISERDIELYKTLIPTMVFK
ncbi:MAG: leucine-rich repeat domain-containing protein [Saprospiraceae bacterium]